MPDFRIHWTRNNEPVDGVAQDPTEHLCTMRASTVQRAHNRVLEAFFAADDLTGFTCTGQELDEDGEPVGDPITL